MSPASMHDTGKEAVPALLRHEFFSRAGYQTAIGVGSRLRPSIYGFPSGSELVYELIKAIDPGFPELARWDQ